MYLLIRYPAGVVIEGVILAKAKNRMRVAAAGFPDTLELKCSGSQWFTSAHEPVEFDFLLSNTNTTESADSSKSTCIAAVAGHAMPQN